MGVTCPHYPFRVEFRRSADGFHLWMIAIENDAASDQILPNLQIERGHRYELAAQFFILARHYTPRLALLLFANISGEAAVPSTTTVPAIMSFFILSLPNVKGHQPTELRLVQPLVGLHFQFHGKAR